MTAAAWLQLAALIALVARGTRLLGRYLADVLRRRASARATGSSCRSSGSSTGCRGIDRAREQRWTVYALGARLQRWSRSWSSTCCSGCQAVLPLNPTDVGAVPAALAFNTAVSFVDQHELAELRRRVDDEPPHARWPGWRCRTSCPRPSGIGVAVALIRGLARRRSATIGNFWVDLVRGTVRILLPLVDRGAPGAGEPGRDPELRRRHRRARRSRAPRRSIPGGPVRQPGGHQGAGHQRRRLPQRQLGPPVREPQRRSPTCCRCSCILLIPFALTYTFGSMVKDQKQGWAVFARDVRPLDRLSVGAGHAASRSAATRSSTTVGADSGRSRADAGRRQPRGQGGPLRPRRLRALRGGDHRHVDRRGERRPRQLHAGRRRRAARQHDARRGQPRRRGRRPLRHAVFALLAVFIAGLMVGRTPEYLGKKIQAAEMKLVVLYILAVPLAVLGLHGGVGAARLGARVDPATPGRPRPDRGHLRVHVGGQQQRLGLRRPHRRRPTGTTPRSGSPCSSAASC